MKTLRDNAAELAFGDRKTFEAMPPQIRAEMAKSRTVATAAAIQRAFLWCALFTLAGLAVSAFLPLRPKEVTR